MGVFERAPPASRIDLAEEPEFDLGGMKVIPAERVVLFNGDRRELQPRVMKVLVGLARASPMVVSRDRIIEQCWDGRIVGDDALNRCILALRHLSRQFTPRPFAIETVPRVGHRLLAKEGRKNVLAAVGRRGLLAAGGAVTIASVGGLAWLGSRSGALPSEAQPLVEGAKAAMLEGTVDQFANAVAKLKKAVELAPGSAEAWGLLALAYEREARLAPEKERSQLVGRGLAAAKRALAIDGDQPDALAAMILALPEYRNWLAYERACRRALRRHPDDPELNLVLAKLLAQVGRCTEALRHLDITLARQAMAPGHHVFRTILLWSLGQLDDAESGLDRAFRLWPRHIGLWFTRFHFLAYNGRPATALAMLADTARRPIGIPEWNFELSGLQARALETGDALTIAEALAASASAARRGTGFAEKAISFASTVNAVDVAYEILAALFFGRGFSVGEAYFTKEQGVYAGSRKRDTYFLFWRPMANVRKDPRFRQLVAGLGLEEYWRRSGTGPD